MNEPDISIVIGYKDWGLERILGAVRSLKNTLVNITGEIIVSDYGSVDSSGHKVSIEAEGATYVRTETDGVWSRSRALNAGLQFSNGRYLITTDADMVFSPYTFEIVYQTLRNDPHQYIVMQCNDLPEGIDHKVIEAGQFTWDALRRTSTLRPRWGMGGMIAVPRTAYIESRGLDERMRIYGGEDIDFARRMRRLGLKLHWLDHIEAQMFHVWHPSSRSAAVDSSSGRRAIAMNRDIQLKDKTASRNLKSWAFPPYDNKPLVTVVISTRNRAQYLEYCIRSVLAQTVPDFELLVIDDGSDDDTADIVKSIGDSRIVYYYQENRGIAAARNFATSVASGKYIAVMDDDDIMLPDRLESSLDAMTDGVNGTYGGWIDFAQENGARQFRTGKMLSLESILFNSAIFLHPTLLVERRLMQAVPYDETLRSGSDYNMAIRMLRSGARFNHCGKYVMLRRNHDGQITAVDPVIQKSAGSISAFFGRAGMLAQDIKTARSDRAEKDKAVITPQKHTEPKVLEYLPDEAVVRRALVRVKSGSVGAKEVSDLLESANHRTMVHKSGDQGDVVYAEYRMEQATLIDVLRLRACPSLETVIETNVLDEGSRMTLAAPIQLSDFDDSAECILSGMLEYVATDQHCDHPLGAVIACGTSSEALSRLHRDSDLEGQVYRFSERSGSRLLEYSVCPVGPDALESVALALRDGTDDSDIEIMTIMKAEARR